EPEETTTVTPPSTEDQHKDL
ncbi:unnamed protein product, partial [Rotaria magnacalcarata]